MLKGYAFTFRPEPDDFIPEADFIPLVWDRKHKDDFTDKELEEGAGSGHGGIGDSSTTDPNGATSMTIDPNPGHGSS